MPAPVLKESFPLPAVELLISIGILGIIAPLLGVALFQILTFTERGRAGFEAQADTRNAAAWISQDIVMAQSTGLTPTAVTNPDCAAPVPTADFTWTDKYNARDDVHTVSYCVKTDGTQDCLPVSPCLVRNYTIGEGIDSDGNTIDSDGNLVSADSNVIARNIVSVDFSAVEFTRASLAGAVGTEVKITIESKPAKNRFGVKDEKIFTVVMRPTI